MPTVVDPSAEVAIGDLPPHILALAHKHIQGFVGGSADQSEDAHDWEHVAFAPQARYLHDPAYQDGAAPAYVELRVLEPAGPLDARGYLLISLTEEDFPVVEFATRGATKTDRVVQATKEGAIHTFMRFTPAYIAGENAQGDAIGALGSVPLTFVGQLPPSGRLQRASFDSETGRHAAPPQSVLNAAPAASYAALKSDFQRNPLRRQSRMSRSKQTAAAWRRSNGVRNPALQLHVGETKDFLIDKPFVSANIEAAGAEEVVRISVLPTGGFQATGLNVGNAAVRIVDQAEAVHDYTLAVTNGQPTIAMLSAEARTTTSRSWYAGSGWEGDQRQYRQLRRDRWCPLVGCGPVALAMLFGWWDANGVPSIFYQLDSGKGDARNFSFNYASLRDSDAPKDTSNEDMIVPLYDDLYGLCNVMCTAVSDQGATAPDQMVGAFREYVNRVAQALPAPQDQYGEEFVGVSWKYSYIWPGLAACRREHPSPWHARYGGQ